MTMKFAYRNSGGPMSWKDGPPTAVKAAPSSLGGLFEPTLTLPAPGAPEPINNAYAMSDYIAVGDSGDGLGDCGCGCKGAGTCGGKSMGATDAGTTVLRVGSAAAAYLAYKQAKKSKGAMKYVLYAIAAAAGYEAVAGS